MKGKLLIGTLLLAILSSCRIGEVQNEKRGPYHVVATTGIIGDVLKNVLGDSAEVTSMMGPGTDPHIYKPTPGDIEMLDDADIIVANGLHLEGKMSEMLSKYGKEKPVIFVSDGIADELLLKSADFDDSYDPHIWFDPEIWMAGIQYVVSEISAIDSSSSTYYQSNFEAYSKQVFELDDWIRSELATIDSAQRVLVTSHDAFSYFGKRYGIEVKGIQGISTLSEVGLKDISAMVDFVIERQIKSIFIETSTSDKTAQSIVEGCAAKGNEVALAGPLFSDALGEPDTDGGTYLGMIKTNVLRITEGLK